MAESLSHSLHAVRIPVPASPLSPLHSPKRRQQLPLEEDQLLGKLSPEAILDALAAINAVSKHERQAKDLLTRSISQVSPEDRALGARAAIAAKKLREWLKEIQAWQWPKGLRIQQGKGFEPPSAEILIAQVEYWGSLPASLVREYEARIEEIHNDMDSLNVDELKEHIMNVHIPGRSRPSSAHSSLSSISAPPFTHMQLSDFTAIITATILRALPTLARLSVLLDIWGARLLVLRQIPGLLNSLDDARASLDSAMAMLSTEISLHNRPGSDHDLTSTREALVQVIGVAGSRMDTVLDALEGREDSIPEIWIETMDGLEADFASWVQRAEKLLIEREWRTDKDESITSAVDSLELHRDVPVNQQTMPDPAREHDSETLIEGLPLTCLEEDASSPSKANHISPLESLANSPTTIPDTAAASITGKEETSEPATPNHATTPHTKVLPTSQSSLRESLNATSSATTEVTTKESVPDFSLLVSDLSPKQEQTINEIDIHGSPEAMDPTEEAFDTLISHKQSEPQKTDLRPDQGTSELCDAEQPQSPSESVIIHSDSCHAHENRPDATLVTPEYVASQPEESSNPIFSPEEHSILEESLLTITTDPTSVPGIDHSSSRREDSLGGQSTGSDKDVDANSHILEPQNVSLRQPVAQPVHDSKPLDSEELERKHLETTWDESGSGNLVLDLNDDESSSPSVQLEDPKSVSAILQLPDGDDVEEKTKSYLEESPARELTADRRLNPSSQPTSPLDPDVPVQSIESDIDENLPSESIAPASTRTTSSGPAAHDLTVHFSPGLFSSASDRTIRGTGSPQLSSSTLHDFQSFQHSKNASLPLQRFIDDESDVNYSINHNMHSDSSPSRGELSDSSPYFREHSNVPRLRHRSESPPPNVVPRPAVRGPSSSLMRGTISSLNKVVGSTSRHPSDTSNYENMSERLHSRHRLGSPYDVDSDSTPWRRKSSAKGFLQAPNRHLQNQPSMESIGSYASSNGTGRRKYSFSTDGGSFAIRPVNEADSDLQEKIHTILTGIPGKIRLSNNPASDYDQQSVISSMSSSKRNRIKARSPFSTPSRAGTPTPSEGFPPSSSRQRRTTSHKSEDKTVRVYHLHHRGKAEPTKLFVRTVGEDGERVMVRVGGGWADLGEYLREYVLHHGRQTPSSSNVEVKGLPTISNSPISPASTATAVAILSSPDHLPTMGDRPASSLSIRKTRRNSRPSEFSEPASDSVDTAADHLPMPSFPSGRRTSISSINSVSVTSILGDGSSVYSPYPGSARTPHSVSTPLGLAGPTPRNRHVSMTPESEAWVEDVIGQARRTSSNAKPAQKHNDHHPMNRDVLNSSRMSTRSVSDLTSAGRNKRVILKGLE